MIRRKEITAYKTVYAEISLELDIAVCNGIKAGWQPYGDQYRIHNCAKWGFYQPMVRYKKEREK